MIQKYSDGTVNKQFNINSINNIKFDYYVSGPSTVSWIFTLILIILTIVGVFASINEGSTAGLLVNFFLWGGLALLINHLGNKKYKRLIITSKGAEVILVDYSAKSSSDDVEAKRIYNEVKRLIRY